MRAWFLKEQGSLDGMVYGDYPDPEPGPGEALICVRGCALNRVDLFAVLGRKGLRGRAPAILGRDFAGEVVRFGPGTAASVGVGERVLVAPHVTCSTCEFCVTDRDNMCERAITLGASVDGGLAE